jgi:hypothetical protein
MWIPGEVSRRAAVHEQLAALLGGELAGVDLSDQRIDALDGADRTDALHLRSSDLDARPRSRALPFGLRFCIQLELDLELWPIVGHGRLQQLEVPKEPSANGLGLPVGLVLLPDRLIEESDRAHQVRLRVRIQVLHAEALLSDRHDVEPAVRVPARATDGGSGSHLRDPTAQRSHLVTIPREHHPEGLPTLHAAPTINR